MMKVLWHNILGRKALMRLLLVVALVNGQWSMAHAQDVNEPKTGTETGTGTGTDTGTGTETGTTSGSETQTQGGIKIGGNVYGGGNSADVLGNTKVTVCKGELNKVFGGARMANVGCTTFVNIDGKESTGDIIISEVYGGNDVAGIIGQSSEPTTVPAELENVIPEPTAEQITEAGSRKDYYEKYKKDHPKLNIIDNTWKTFVATSRSTKEVTTVEGESAVTKTKEDNWILIGSTYGGGNGNFIYTNDDGTPLQDSDGNYIVQEKKDNVTITVATKSTPFTLPELDKTYLEIKGGELAHVYGGGNKATVRVNTTINIDNESEYCQGYVEKKATELWNSDPEQVDDEEAVGDHTLKYYVAATINGLKEMSKLSSFQSNITSFNFNHARVFGGNNIAEMAIRPTWNLQQGCIRDLFSGGNKGDMTSPEGLLLEINPAEKNTSSPYVYNANQNDKDLIVDNVFGGCRMANVKPSVNGVYTPTTNLDGYGFPDELSARVLIRGGDINNVYGGNDITGTVYGGNAIGVYSSIRGDIYGGGNGAYAYTNNDNFKDHDIYGDFYYSDDLNSHRPNAEQVSIHLMGKTKEVNGETVPDYTIIKGSVYIGGNCAGMDTKKANPLMELKMGDYVIADKVFLGNNGAKMVDKDILKLYSGYVDDYGNIADSGSGYQYTNYQLTNKSEFATYMEGVTMNLQPKLVFDGMALSDKYTYTDNTSYVGSFFCGGNVGSMAIPGKNIYNITRGLNIFDKFVGGCNSADVEEQYDEDGTQLCASYEGGVLGAVDERGSDSNSNYYTDSDGNIKDRLEINLANLTITPLRWNDDKTMLIWNTNKWDDYAPIESGTEIPKGAKYYTKENNTYTEHTADASIIANGTQFWGDFVPVPNSAVDEIVGEEKDHSIRLLGGNVYGGCYNSGHVNGNVVINIDEDVLKRDEVFGEKSSPSDKYPSGVRLLDQRDDVNAVALTVFGAGYGEGTEIWGSSTVNLNKGYAFQIFGGGEQGVVGKKRDVKDEQGIVTSQEYYYDPAYSTTVNLKGASAVYSDEGKVDDLAETEYIYGGGNEGDVCGNTYVNLGYGRVYDAFGGSSNADILGHTEVYIGRQPDGSGGYKDGFPWIKDIVYGGNDFGGTISGGYKEGYDFTARVRDYAHDKDLLHGLPTNEKPGVLRSASYVEYLQGRVDTIFGGNYGYYDYASEMYEGSTVPFLESSFVNIRPKVNANNYLSCVFGGGTGYPNNRDGDKSQDRSYVLIDIPKNGDNEVELFKDVRVFGSGAYNGMGMRFDKAETFAGTFNPDLLSSVVDLLRGDIRAVYGGSYNEGVTARTVINVPAASTILIDSIFGGAYGTQILPPCDVFESNVNYRSGDATVTGAIYGGNNNERRTLYAKVNVSAPVWSNKANGYLSTVYGAGHGIDSWAEYTEVNLENNARVYEVYGGGEMGHVLNAESVQKYMQLYKDRPSPQIGSQDPYWKNHLEDLGSNSAKARWAKDWKDAWTLGGYYTPTATDGDGHYTYTDYVTNSWTNLTNTALVTHNAGMDDRDFTGYTTEEKTKRQYKYNTNVLIHEGAVVEGYAYGGGLGDDNVARSGDVYGTSYIALLGGTVLKDIYAAGTTGAVYDLFGVGKFDATIDADTGKPKNPHGFTASANAYVKGGSCRNVYGGGWKGNVGAHIDPTTLSSTNDITIAPTLDIPGETHVVIGDVSGSSFTSGLPTVQRNAYGGGEGGAVYGTAHLTLNNGYVGYQYNATSEEYEEKIEDDTKTTPNTLLTDAGCLFGGGYIDNSVVDKTSVKMYGGHVRGSIFAGGEIAAIGRGSINKTTHALEDIYRPGKTHVEMYGGNVGRNVFGGGRGIDNLGNHGSLSCDGFVFGQTEVHIHGGEIGTISGVADGNGNVYGGGDEGFVYSAYENADGTFGLGVKPEGSERYKDDYQGYYFKHKWDNAESLSSTTNLANDGFYYETVNGKQERLMTEDCKVLIEPHMKVLANVTIDGHEYKKGEYVPTSDLNKLKNKYLDSDKWECLDSTGITIHNAVFAGGNVPSGSLTTNANTATVFGNATASINDIFHRDMIMVGTRHTGGLYGDGNLTLVDGYRELNITNYGTDYYSIAKQIGIDAYHSLPKRVADYYELRYKCLKECKDKDGTVYKSTTTDANGFTTKASTITADEMQSLFVEEVEVTENGQTVKKQQSVKYNGVDVLVYNKDRGEWVPNTAEGANFWEESGVLPVYAGRLMNSIQRADFCGVFGSRMVMQGAQDRVPEEVDYTNYTINRVREVSLNKMNSVISGDEAPFHGNYFGIYNIVHYLGALTSDVDFGDDTHRPYARTTDNTTDNSKYKCAANGKDYGVASFYDWKKEFTTDRKRNNGNSHNKVALASGVYLEITSEQSTGDGLYEKVWGPITGVIELDLINVTTGIGGGFVYAKNQHGVRSISGLKNTTLTALNENAVTQWDFNYNTADEAYNGGTTGQQAFETSGNFVHSTQTIIDDCYNVSNKYMGDGAMPAHYWYIKGSTYVYDQYISAYTGIPNAYSETVDIPLTISAASNGKMKLLNVQPNLYAYYSSPGVKLEEGKKVVINDKTYYKNDPISYWDWYLLSNSEKALFVEETYTNCMTYYDPDGTEHKAGTVVMKDTDYDTYKKTSAHTYKDAEGNDILDANKQPATDDYIFRLSNNVSHGTGYILTYEVNNPSIWDNWFTPKTDVYTGKITLAAYETSTNKANYYDGPTYRLNPDKLAEGETGKLIGQRDYEEGDLIPKSVEDTYQAITNKPTSGQATFVPAYIVTNTITIEDGDSERHYNIGTTVPNSFASNSNYSSSVAEAYICTNSIEITKENIIFKDSKMTKSKAESYTTSVKSQMNELRTNSGDLTIDQIKALTGITDENRKKLIELATLRDDLNTYLVPAYYCTVSGKYGGDYYTAGKNYRALEAWSSMSEADHQYFTFNYDALDLLIDPNYDRAEGQKYQYDGSNYYSEEAVRNETTGNPAGYSVTQSIDYTASYNSTTSLNLGEGNIVNVKRDNGTENTSVIQKDDELTRNVFESLLNERRHYAPISVPESGDYYVVNTSFQIGSTPYAAGETISAETYAGLPTEEKKCVTKLTFTGITSQTAGTFYYCRDSYTVESGGHSVTNANNQDVANTYKVTAYNSDNQVCNVTGTFGANATVPLGLVIPSSTYNGLTNQQMNFTIHGIAPTETSTLYVSRESDIYNLSKEKIITVIYQYDYDETDSQGNITPISERHVVNIHLTFKSGVPTVADITAPGIILPGDWTSLREPTVTPGAYEVLGGGWELFETEHDAESHSNGIDYTPLEDPLYWYQDGYYVAYYAKSYAGRTYSNFVPVSVANYHDIAEVMADKDHHMFIDHKNVKRASKIYLNNYGSSKNGLDLFKNLYDLSVLSGSAAAGSPLYGHAPLNSRVQAGTNLEFFLRTDIDHSGSAAWTPIASGGNDPCFNGVLHGDGHTISGLTPATGTTGSLFGKLCGSVYNLGVTGSFTGSGVADEGDGYVESCWVKTSVTSGFPTEIKPVFGGSPSVEHQQTVNCYYPESNSFFDNTGNSTKAKPIMKPDRAFYNGEVAYDLNNFYLYKRYNDKMTAGGDGYVRYSYFTVGEDNTLTLQPDKYYASNPSLCSSGYIGTHGIDLAYVEDRFDDGDFRFAVGNTSGVDDERYHAVTVTTTGGATKEEDHWYPIWPDDYIFFGQKLTYDWASSASEKHQNVPTAVVRDGGRLSHNDDANRVYRAPAYFGSSVMGVAHFNPKAYLAQTRKNYPATLAYPGMTAIDFAGHNATNEVTGTFALGSVAASSSGGSPAGTATWFYPPLLDDDGLTGIVNCDETKNLLVYAPAATSETGYANAATNEVLTAYFVDPSFDDYYDNSDGYRIVHEKPEGIPVYGHLVPVTLKATNDHFLVDKQDFNAPIAYTFDSDHRMWYQRKPADKEYVEPVWNGNERSTKGWQGISIPFTAELVTTHQKGEITHFYQGHTTGHEYWLRELSAITPGSSVAKADFVYPSATGSDKTYTNTFFWDYYYKNEAIHNQLDENLDTYLGHNQKYYKSSHTHQSYPLLTASTPYIIGMPGKTYYEFDLSGNFLPQHTAADNNTSLSFNKLEKQVITFASNTGISIAESDNELRTATSANTKNGYAFVPTYSKRLIEAGSNAFTLSANGDSYDKVPAAGTGTTTTVEAFRPYFTVAASGSRPDTRSIVFSNGGDQELQHEDHSGSNEHGTIIVSSERHKILVTSTLRSIVTVRIVNTNGITLNTFILKPGETVETRVSLSGVYMVQTLDEHFIKKIAVK